MSKTISIELPDEVFEAIQAMAAETGRSAHELALEWLVRSNPKPRPKLTALIVATLTQPIMNKLMWVSSIDRLE